MPPTGNGRFLSRWRCVSFWPKTLASSPKSCDFSFAPSSPTSEGAPESWASQHRCAVVFLQRFGSALQLTPHLHVLVPEGGWDADGCFHPLPPPTAEDVEAVLSRVLRRLTKSLSHREETWPEDGLEALWAEGVQKRLPFREDEAPRRRAQRLCVQAGFSL
ncbi:MAG: transposase, partial [Myxococcaceae bacterium]